MKPPPDLNDEAAMLKRGRVSALYSARKEAIELLRDAFTAMQQGGGEFGPALALNARIARDAADRLLTLAAMWHETTAPDAATEG
jgi:hypothetical protein